MGNPGFSFGLCTSRRALQQGQSKAMINIVNLESVRYKKISKELGLFILRKSKLRCKGIGHSHQVYKELLESKCNSAWDIWPWIYTSKRNTQITIKSIKKTVHHWNILLGKVMEVSGDFYKNVRAKFLSGMTQT